MTYPEPLQKALRSGDIIAIRAALIAIVDKDKDNTTPQAIKIADAVSSDLRTQNISLFVSDNGRYKLPPEGDWTVDTWHGIKAAMQTNFSREKFVWADQVRMKIFHTAPSAKRTSATGPETPRIAPRISNTESFSSRYEIIEPLRIAIEKNDLIAIRSALITMVDRDYSRTTNPIARHVAIEVGDYLRTHNGVEIFESDNGRLILPPPAEWTKDTWHGVKAAMQTNFSKEKFVLAEEIMRSLKSKEAISQPQNDPNNLDGGNRASSDFPRSIPTNEPRQGQSRQRPHFHHQRPSSYRSNQQPAFLITGGVLIVGGIIVGAIVAGTIGAIIGGGAGLAVSVKILNTRK